MAAHRRRPRRCCAKQNSPRSRRQSRPRGCTAEAQSDWATRATPGRREAAGDLEGAAAATEVGAAAKRDSNRPRRIRDAGNGFRKEAILEFLRTCGLGGGSGRATAPRHTLILTILTKLAVPRSNLSHESSSPLDMQTRLSLGVMHAETTHGLVLAVMYLCDSMMDCVRRRRRRRSRTSPTSSWMPSASTISSLIPPSKKTRVGTSRVAHVESGGAGGGGGLGGSALLVTNRTSQRSR